MNLLILRQIWKGILLMKNLYKFDKIFSQVNKSVSAGLDRLVTLFDDTMDEDIRLYNNLLPEDLDELSKIYGKDEIMDYIKTMEVKRLGVKYGTPIR